MCGRDCRTFPIGKVMSPFSGSVNHVLFCLGCDRIRAGFVGNGMCCEKKSGVMRRLRMGWEISDLVLRQ